MLDTKQKPCLNLKIIVLSIDVALIKTQSKKLWAIMYVIFIQLFENTSLLMSFELLLNMLGMK